METQSTSKLGSLIAGAGEDIGKGIVRRRTEAESKRRFDVTAARLQQSQVDLKLAALQDKQAAQTAFHEMNQAAADAALGEASSTGEVSQDTQDAFKSSSQAIDPTDWAGPYRAQYDASNDPGATPQERNKLGADFFTQHPEVDPSHPYVAPEKPLLGESGIPLLSSVEAASKAADAKAQLQGLQEARRAYRIANAKGSLSTKEDRDRATATLRGFETRIAAASTAFGSYTRQAAVGAKAESEKAQRDQFDYEEGVRQRVAAAGKKDAAMGESMKAAGKDDAAHGKPSASQDPHYLAGFKEQEAAGAAKEEATAKALASARTHFKTVTGKEPDQTLDAADLRTEAASFRKDDALAKKRSEYAKDPQYIAGAKPLDQKVTEAERALSRADGALFKAMENPFADPDAVAAIKAEVEARKAALGEHQGEREKYDTAYEARKVSGDFMGEDVALTNQDIVDFVGTIKDKPAAVAKWKALTTEQQDEAVKQAIKSGRFLRPKKAQ